MSVMFDGQVFVSSTVYCLLRMTKNYLVNATL